MGGSHSVDHALQGRIAAQVFSKVVQSNYEPFVGIHDSLWKYSGTDSNAVLNNEYSNSLNSLDASKLPAYVRTVGTTVGAFTTIPHAAGMGALVVSIILEIALAVAGNKPKDIPDMLRQVFAEEKASAIRDTMHEYLKRNRILLLNRPQLETEMLKFEQQLSEKLTILRNSMLDDNHMNTRAMRHWVNGAAFHVLLQIHMVRVKDSECGGTCSDIQRISVRNTIDIYLEDLDRLLPKYQRHKASRISFISANPYKECTKSISQFGGGNCKRLGLPPPVCSVNDADMSYRLLITNGPSCTSDTINAYVERMFAHSDQITGMKRYFTNTKNNLNTLMNQQGDFTVLGCKQLKEIHPGVTCNDSK